MFVSKNPSIIDDSLKNKVDNGIKWVTISMVFNSLMLIIKQFILSRILTPDVFGIVSIIMIIINFGRIFEGLGIPSAIINFQNVEHRTLSSLLYISIISGFVSYLILFFLSPFLSLLFKTDITVLIQFTGIIFFILPVGLHFQSLLKKNFHFKAASINEIVSSTIIGIISIIFAYYGFGAFSLVIGYVSGLTLLTTLNVITGLKIWKPSLCFEFKEIKKFIRFGLYQSGERTINFFTSNLDKIFIGTFFGTILLGYYEIAFNLIFVPIGILNGLNYGVFFPFFSKHQDDIQKLKNAFNDFLKILLVILMPVYMIIFSVADKFVYLLYGDQWTNSIPIVQILSFFGFIMCLKNYVLILQVSIGKVKELMIFKLFLLIPHIIIFYYFILLNNFTLFIHIILSVEIGYFLLFFFKFFKCEISSFKKDFFMYFNKYLLFSSIFLLPYLRLFKLTAIIQTFIALLLYILILIKFDRNTITDFFKRFIKGFF